MKQTLVPVYKYSLPFLALAAMLLLLSYCVPANSSLIQKRYLVTAYGAKGDGLTLNTAAIQKAIDQCSAKGGGVVVIPKGTFVTGAIFLKKDVSLKVEENGVLKGSVNQEDYPQVQTRWEGTEMLFTAALLNAENLQGISITGPGTIDGSGEVWAERGRQQREQQRQNTLTTPVQRLGRPRLICIQNCSVILISDLQLLNQASWGLHVLYSNHVNIQNLTIRAAHDIPSSDGIDIDSSREIGIADCDIDVNDDCISIKSGKDEDGLRVNRPSENISIINCRFGYGHGGVAMGSETSGGIRNVTVTNCVAEADNWAPIRFKSQPSRGGVVENITFDNLQLNNTRKAVEFNMAWRMVPPVKPAAEVLPVVRNVQLLNIRGTVNRVGDIRGLPESPIRGVTFRGCHLVAQKGLLLEHVTGLDTIGLYSPGLTLEVKEGPAIIHADK